MLKKNITIIASLFPKLLPPKIVVSWMSDGSCFRPTFVWECVNGSLTRPKPPQLKFYPNFLITSDKLSWKKIFLSQMWNLTTVLQHLDSLLHLFSSELREIPKTSSNAIIFRTIKIFPNPYYIFEIYSKFYAFWKKRSHS